MDEIRNVTPASADGRARAGAAVLDRRRLTILLADGHNLVRQALRSLLEKEADLRVVGETADGMGVADLVLRLEPDVLVSDLMLPGLGAIEVARHVLRRRPSTRIVILSTDMNEAHVRDALRSGVHGYVRKDATADDLIHAIREVAVGNGYLSPPFSDQAAEAYRKNARDGNLDPYEKLTDREREVLYLAAMGLGNMEIGDQLAISPRTVETHRAHMMRKLGLKRLTDVVRYALRRGILPTSEEMSPEPADRGSGPATA